MNCTALDTFICALHFRATISGNAIERIDQSDDVGSALKRVAQSQENLLDQLSYDKEQDNSSDAESRMRLRSIETQLVNIFDEISAERKKGDS